MRSIRGPEHEVSCSTGCGATKMAGPNVRGYTCWKCVVSGRYGMKPGDPVLIPVAANPVPVVKERAPRRQSDPERCRVLNCGKLRAPGQRFCPEHTDENKRVAMCEACKYYDRCLRTYPRHRVYKCSQFVDK